MTHDLTRQQTPKADPSIRPEKTGLDALGISRARSRLSGAGAPITNQMGGPGAPRPLAGRGAEPRSVSPNVPGFFWADQDDWHEAHQCLDMLFEKHGSGLDVVRDEAGRAGDKLQQLFPLFDDFCARVCPRCRAVCCLEARVAYDFKDILFLHALGLPPPPHQLRRHDGEHCRYFEPEGCRLERILRPFICTWYYCAPMIDLFRGLPARQQRRMSGLMMEVQEHRRRMEDEFIRRTSF